MTRNGSLQAISRALGLRIPSPHDRVRWTRARVSTALLVAVAGLGLGAAACDSGSKRVHQTGTGGAAGSAPGGKTGNGGSAAGGSAAGGSSVGGSAAGGSAAGGSSVGGTAAGGSAAGGAGGATDPMCGVPIPVTSPPYPTQIKFRNDGTVPLYLHEGCIGVDYGISSCTSGFRDSVGPAYHCACACENTTCTGGVVCGACPANTGGAVAAGGSLAVSWDAVVRTDEDRGSYTCVRSQFASPGRYRIAVRVFDDAATARDGIGGRVVTQDFQLPAAGGLVEVAIATVASDACSAAPTASTPACTGGEAHDQPCRLTLSMNYANEGGLGVYSDSSAIAPPAAFTLTRKYNGGASIGRICMATLPICTRDGREVTTGDLTRVLTAPIVVSSFASGTTPVFGYDPRPVDGQILVLRSPDGKSLGIGADRPGTSSPQAIQDLRTVFTRLDLQMRATPECAVLNQ